MRIRSCFLLVLSLGLGTTSAEVLWYGGDSIGGPNGGFINNTRVPGVGFSFSVLDDFVVSGDPWHVTALFSNNSGSSQTPPPITEATWSVRIGASPNDRGHILFSGVSPASASPTGRVEGLEYQIMVRFVIQSGAWDLLHAGKSSCVCTELLHWDFRRYECNRYIRPVRPSARIV